jgi:hypothetical protein
MAHPGPSVFVGQFAQMRCVAVHLHDGQQANLVHGPGVNRTQSQRDTEKRIVERFCDEPFLDATAC